MAKPNLTQAIVELLAQTKRNTALLEKLTNTPAHSNALSAPTVEARNVFTPKCYCVRVEMNKATGGSAERYKINLPIELVGKRAKIEVYKRTEWQADNGIEVNTYFESTHMLDRLPAQLSPDTLPNDAMRVYQNKPNKDLYGYSKEFVIWVFEDAAVLTVEADTE